MTAATPGSQIRRRRLDVASIRISVLQVWIDLPTSEHCRRHIFCICRQVGSVGRFDLLAFLVNLTVAFSLLKLANIVTDFLGGLFS